MSDEEEMEALINAQINTPEFKEFQKALDEQLMFLGECRYHINNETKEMTTTSLSGKKLKILL